MSLHLAGTRTLNREYRRRRIFTPATDCPFEELEPCRPSLGDPEVSDESAWRDVG
jgi:hypothetical protein